jgi:hypothetical protein
VIRKEDSGFPMRRQVIIGSLRNFEKSDKKIPRRNRRCGSVRRFQESLFLENYDGSLCCAVVSYSAADSDPPCSAGRLGPPALPDLSGKLGLSDGFLGCVESRCAYLTPCLSVCVAPIDLCVV